MPVCYKSASACKSLIFNDIPSLRISVSFGQALDFSGGTAVDESAFNKVIHKIALDFANSREIKDLDAVRNPRSKLWHASES